MDDWNDLRLVLAVARAGTLKAAALALGINHSTVFRRLNTLEDAMGVRLFERLPGGVYAPTASGEAALAAAERIEAETAELDRSMAGQDHRLTGLLRVTSSETLAFRLLTAHIARFRGIHPGILIELIIERRVLSLSRREADIALRVTRPREGDLFGRKLADIAWAIYGSRTLLSQTASQEPRPIDLGEWPFIAWDESAGGIEPASWLESNVPDRAVAYRTNSVLNQFMAAKSGIGLALLPCYLADQDSDLQRLATPRIPELTGELWIVTHSDLRRTARVRAFFDIVGEGLISQRELLAGLATEMR